VLQTNLSALIAVINARLHVNGDPAGITITGITNDSRRVVPGCLYVALHGDHTDGHRFIPDAITAGAHAILHTDPLDQYTPGVVYLRTNTPRPAMSALAAAYFGHPSHRLSVIGVTGTDGKTTTTALVHQLLEATGEAAGYLSTAGMKTGDREVANPLHQSTPEAPDVHRTLALMRDAGKRYAVLESTSHGLSYRTARLADVRYAAAVFTNLGHEHLEFHGTFERYRDDKANLFRQVTPNGVGVINAASPEAGYFADACGGRVARYALLPESGRGPEAELTARILAHQSTRTRFRVAWGGRLARAGSADVVLPMPGSFNVENALAAILVVSELRGVSPEALLPYTAVLRGPVGRIHVVAATPFAVVVDYAHTPGSFERVLPLFRATTEGRLIVVFGSAGERDRAKRPIQGRIASQFADIVVLADEDPRGEDRQEILREIAAGCTGLTTGESLFLISERRDAIRHAIGIAQSGDTVLLLGKGHEATIIGADGAVPWDEAAVAREELARVGISPAKPR
jgi:UDP-N-acetylmuramoyl-L-alanyl-D-glutamate--2,6-diaminopimelate ligase